LIQSLLNLPHQLAPMSKKGGYGPVDMTASFSSFHELVLPLQAELVHLLVFGK